MDQIIPIDYRALVDNMTTCILLIDRDLNIYYLNSACEALFDVSHSAPAAHPYSIFCKTRQMSSIPKKP